MTILCSIVTTYVCTYVRMYVCTYVNNSAGRDERSLGFILLFACRGVSTEVTMSSLYTNVTSSSWSFTSSWSIMLFCHHVTVLTLIDSATYVRTNICTYLRTYVLIKMSSQLVLLVIVSPWSVMSHVRTLTLMSPCHCPPSCQTAMDLQEQQVQQTQAAQRPRVSGPVHPSH